MSNGNVLWNGIFGYADNCLRGNTLNRIWLWRNAELFDCNGFWNNVVGAF